MTKIINLLLQERIEAAEFYMLANKPDTEAEGDMYTAQLATEAEVRKLESDNAGLLDALSKMVLQYLSGQDGLLNHMFMSAGEDALEVLEKLGVVRESKVMGEFYEWVSHD